MSLDDHRPHDLLDLALDVAGEAADLLMARRRTDFEMTTKSSATDLVTEVDRAAEDLVRARLLGARPDDGFLGEEGGDVASTSGVTWVVDPIDGTTNYVYGHPGFAVSIAACVDGEAVAGVVWAPLTNDVFSATRAGGATHNGEAITTGAVTDPALALVATGFSYDPATRRAQAAVLGRCIDQVRDIRRMGAASFDLCSVACGRVDAYFEIGLKPWDHAAGALVAREAGAVVGDLDGSPPSEAFILAANPELWPRLATLLGEAGARLN